MKLVEDKDVLRLEEFLKQERDKRAIKFGIFPTLGEEYLFPLVLPLILILTYVFLFFYKDYYRILGAHGVPQYIILFINLVFLFKTIQLRIKASKNYSRVIKL